VKEGLGITSDGCFSSDAAVYMAILTETLDINLYNKNLYFIANIIRVMKSSVRWAGHTALFGEMRN
jgi:hypothetical protein